MNASAKHLGRARGPPSHPAAPPSSSFHRLLPLSHLPPAPPPHPSTFIVALPASILVPPHSSSLLLPRPSMLIPCTSSSCPPLPRPPILTSLLPLRALPSSPSPFHFVLSPSPRLLTLLILLLGPPTYQVSSSPSYPCPANSPHLHSRPLPGQSSSAILNPFLLPPPPPPPYSQSSTPLLLPLGERMPQCFYCLRVFVNLPNLSENAYVVASRSAMSRARQCAAP